MGLKHKPSAFTCVKVIHFIAMNPDCTVDEVHNAVNKEQSRSATAQTISYLSNQQRIVGEFTVKNSRRVKLWRLVERKNNAD